MKDLNKKEELILNFPENHQFINCMYSYKQKDEEGKYSIPDEIIIVSKDKDGEKHITEIKNPEYEFWVTKENGNVNPSEKVNYISFDDCKKVICRYDKRWEAMAKASPLQSTKDYYAKCKNSKDWGGYRDMNLFTEFHSSDINIEDFYIKKFIEINDFKNNDYGLSILAFDIEVDSSEYSGFPREDLAPCPVNLITAFDLQTNTLYTFATKYKGNESFDSFNIDSLKKILKSINKEYKKDLGGSIKLKPYFYDKEINLIAGFFNLVNTLKPDYVTAWNARFDILTLYNRLKQITYSTDLYPEDIMCPEEFPIKNVYIKLDKSKEATDYAKRSDTFAIFGYSNWIDYLCLYANIDLPNGKKETYKLDYIGEIETGKNKKDLSSFGYSIKNVFKENYSLFYEYGCFDTLLLSLIIKNTGFIPLLHNIVGMTRTRPSKALKKTVCERNFGEYYYNLANCAISNNRSNLISSVAKIKGAFVALLDLIEKLGDINGIPSNKIFQYVIDFDLSALYPSIDQCYNISPDTIRYIITISDDESEYREKTEKFFEDYLSGDNINYCVEYHNYPDVCDMITIIENRLKEANSI